MIVAFGKLRPLFRERGKITAEISGRLAESFGGIRIVKAYIAEEREDRVFATGIMSLFDNVRKTLTGISAVTSFGGVVIGAIGVVMMVVGGRAILAGTMTLGDFIMYIFFVGMLAAPLIQMSSIGTQLSEALAGLDRIREIKAMATEDEEDASREPLGMLKGQVVFDGVSFEYDAGVPVLKNVSFDRAGGHDDGARRLERFGEEHADQPGHGVQPSGVRARARGWPRSRQAVRLRDYRSQLGVVLQDNFMFDGTVAENIRFSRPNATMDEVKAVSRIAHCDEFVEKFPAQVRDRSSESAASSCRAASGSASRSRGRFWPIRAC